MRIEFKRWTLIAASAVMALCLNAFTSEAQAQSVNVKKGQLEHATWYKSNMQVQIVDDGPIVHDYRQGPQNDPGFQIPIGPAGANNNRIPEGGIPLGDGPRQVRMERSALPQSGFGASNIPARGMGPAVALPGTKMGGLGGQGGGGGQKSTTGVSARPISRPGTTSAAASPAAYTGGYGSGGGANYGGGGGGSSSTSVRAKLLGH